MSVVLELIRPGRRATILRRTLTISAITLGCVVGFALLPLWVLAAVLVDVLRERRRTRFVRTRLLAFGLGYLACELVGIAVSFALWLAQLVVRPSLARYRQWNFKLQCVWGNLLLKVGQTAFSFRLEVHGAEFVTPGPILLMLRHSSLADTVLAVSQISKPHGILLRYVLKRPLLLDPCIDIVGQRLINLFVLKGSRSKEQIHGVSTLADDLGPSDGVLIYPEGTRFTTAKREAHIEKLERRADHEELDFARSLRHVLPPIRGGVLALLERNQELDAPADVVFCAHRGFEGSATVRELLAGNLLDRTVQIRFWRVPAGEIPTDRIEQLAWLRAQWQRMDQEIESLSHP